MKTCLPETQSSPRHDWPRTRRAVLSPARSAGSNSRQHHFCPGELHDHPPEWVGCSPPQFERSVQRLQRNQGIGSWKRQVRALAFLGDGLPPGNERRVAQLRGTVRPRPVSVAAGSQRHERAGWDGPAPLLPLLAAGSNALAPYGAGQRPRYAPPPYTPLIPAAGHRLTTLLDDNGCGWSKYLAVAIRPAGSRRAAQSIL